MSLAGHAKASTVGGTAGVVLVSQPGAHGVEVVARANGPDAYKPGHRRRRAFASPATRPAARLEQGAPIEALGSVGAGTGSDSGECEGGRVVEHFHGEPEAVRRQRWPYDGASRWQPEGVDSVGDAATGELVGHDSE